MNLPDAFLQSLPISEGEKSDFIASLHTEPPASVRVNGLKAEIEQGMKLIAWSSNGYYLKNRPRYTSDPAFHAGAYYPQESSSMFLSFLLKKLNLADKPIRVLDLCASPGGKSTVLKESLHFDSFLLSNEVIQSRLGVLQDNLSKWAHLGYAISNRNPAKFEQLEGYFDLIVVDAPCSGEGLFRKQPEAVTQWSTKNVEMCAARQKRILADVWRALAPNGTLVYSTCTYNRLENEDNIEWLQDEFSASSIDIGDLPHEGIEKIGDKKVLGYRFMPHRLEGEGFFISAIQKSSGTVYKEKKVSSKPLQVFNENEDILWVTDEQNMAYAVKAVHLNDLAILKSIDRRIVPGQFIGKKFGDTFKPQHGLAMLSSFSGNIEAVHLDLENALRFLEKNDIRDISSQSDFVQVFFERFSLGFAKKNRDRLLSQYPAVQRVLAGKPDHYHPLVKALNQGAV